MSNAYLVNPTGSPEVCYRGNAIASAQVLGTGTTTLSFDTSVVSTPTVLVSGNSIFTINTTGLYNLAAQINAVASGGAAWTVLQKLLFIEVTRSAVAIVVSGESHNITNGSNFLSGVDAVHYLIAGDEIRFKFTQTTTAGTVTNTPTIATGGGTYALISLLRTI